jgi:hypothetical protein
VHNNLKPSTLETARENAWFSADPLDGVAQFTLEMGEIEAAQIPQLDPFDLLPETFARVQLRSIGWQALHILCLVLSVVV